MTLHALGLTGVIIAVLAVFALQYVTNTTTQEVVALTFFVAGAWLDMFTQAAAHAWGWFIADTAILMATAAWLFYALFWREEPADVDE